MQLAKLIKILSVLAFVSMPVFSQNSGNNDDRPTEVDFLFNYYEQDGDHSAVTGGEGSQDLSDYGPQIIVNVPMKNNNLLSLSFGFDSYSSASSDKIDPFTVSGESSGDMRIHIDADYTINLDDNGNAFGFSLGASKEWDYQSYSFGGHWAHFSKDGSRGLNLNAKVYLDNVTLVFPIEHRDPADFDGEDWNYDNASRNTFLLSATYSQILSRRAQFSVTVDLTYQTGYLGTPFHRVFFPGRELARIETLPDNRFKVPVGLRFNYYLSDFIVARFNYRYYWDDFGVIGNTLGIETPLRFSKSIAVTPFYRYHTQTASDYFNEPGKQSPDAQYFTTDYDLSAFNSHKYGLGFRYYPVWGIADFSWPFSSSLWEISRLDLRVSLYNRSDGLDAFTISFGTKFLIK